MTKTFELIPSPDFGYDKNLTIQLTQSAKNQYIDHLSNHISGLAKAYFYMVNCLSCCGGCSYDYQLLANYNVVVMRYGIITKILREPGFYNLNDVGVKTHSVYVGGWQTTFNDEEMNDHEGIPKFVSATFNYQVVDPIAVVIFVQDYQKYVRQQARIAIQKSFANFYYWEDVAKNAINILKTYTASIGVQINSLQITAVKVSTKFHTQFIKQKAQAFVDGHRTIANEAFSTLKETLNHMEEQGNLTAEKKISLAVNMTYMLCQTDRTTLNFLQQDPSSDQLKAFITTKQQ